ncbi:MAG: aminopeptidase P family protein [Alphaproteobacteria bacterium]|nr:aminopeptidase P family protein [Alphaproteobacteria bacterium]
MADIYQQRVADLQERMRAAGHDSFVVYDADTIYYLSGYWGYLGMEFDRATLIVVPATGNPVLITPAMEAEMARNMTSIADVREWMDGVDGEWMRHLADILEARPTRSVAVERYKTHSRVMETLGKLVSEAALVDAASIIGEMRIVKSAEDIAVMRQAGQVAAAMARAGQEAIGEGVPEYEMALAVINAGSRKGAELLEAVGEDHLASPMIYNLQIMQSGQHTCMVHRRSTVKRLVRGDPVYFCFCGIANFKQFKLGFDRSFFVSEVTDEQARIYELALAAQQTALAQIRPGAIAEEVHAAAEEVYRSAGFSAGYRTGRGVGYSFLENPQLKAGDRTILMPGMTMAVDGGINVPGDFGARIGDSIVVTESGFDYLTDYPRDLTVA